MKFCEDCENMMFIDVDKRNRDLVYYCKSCNKKTSSNASGGSILVVDDNKMDDETKYAHFINKNLIHDPTLPRVNNILCTNEKCTRKKNQDNEVIYIKYDQDNMKYLYFCCHCEHFWKNN